MADPASGEPNGPLGKVTRPEYWTTPSRQAHGMHDLAKRLRRSLRILSATTVLVLLVVISSLHSLPQHVRTADLHSQWKLPLVNSTQHDSSLGLQSLPEYNLEPYETSFCAERFGRKYLENLSDSRTGYCTPNSQPNLICFHSRTVNSRVDMFCFGRSAVYDVTDKKFALSCEPRVLTAVETLEGTPALSELTSYWYDTGPRVVFDKAVEMDINVKAPNSTRNFTILLKREGSGNLWHSLMEILSLTMTIDVLRITRGLVGGEPLFDLGDEENTQIVILDDHDNGPYFDLWSLFAKRPVVRWKDVSESTKVENIIIPLAGGGNPYWQGDWEINQCERSPLLHTFAHRVLDLYNIKAWAPHEGDIVLTFIDRKKTRRLIDNQSLLDELKTKVPHLKIQIIDFGSISFEQQLRTIRQTDILVGVHGAGLTHGMFLREGSVMVEILPENMNHKGFRNLAGLMGNMYLSAHASKTPEDEGNDTDWHEADVFLNKERFLGLMEVAVKALYNAGFRNYDTI
ncbi:DUF563 domain protein [Leptodontidium sp. 2 PMI_412]|nr:DUF563 domain protein [Leptodontidium sp. 2 PMI_412]